MTVSAAGVSLCCEKAEPRQELSLSSTVVRGWGVLLTKACLKWLLNFTMCTVQCFIRTFTEAHGHQHQFQSIFTIAGRNLMPGSHAHPSLRWAVHLLSVLKDAILDVQYKQNYVVLSCPAWLLSGARMFSRVTNAVA